MRLLTRGPKEAPDPGGRGGGEKYLVFTIFLKLVWQSDHGLS